MQIIECVPNFSEGRDLQVIDAITTEIKEVEGVKLLDVDPGADTNRTVVTFVGTPEAVKEAAFRAISKAAELIDMSVHRGAHARMGATDVCPFVPVTGVSMEDCIQVAHQVGKRVGEELNIPVYLYEHAAQHEDRRNLANIRKGEYEGLPDKLQDPHWQPDYGPAKFNKKSGATVIGAREFLIAFNVNLNTKSRKLAHEIALNIREKGRAKRDKNGEIIRDEHGKAIKVPGKLKEVKGVGWYIDEYKLAQVSMNLTNYKVTPPHIAYETIREEAEKLGLIVTGCELVGLIPKEAMLMAGKYFLQKQGLSAGVPEEDLIETAILSMGLNSLTPFEPEKKIIEFQVQAGKESLTTNTVHGFVNEVSRSSPAPGGGSVAALAGSLGAALGSMVAGLTHGKKDYMDTWAEMENLAIQAQSLKDFFLKSIDEDTNAFNKVMETYRIKAKTDEAKQEKMLAIEEANKMATLVPFQVLEKIPGLLDLVQVVAEKGNINSVSDAGVAARMAVASADGAYYNVVINLKNIENEKFAKDMADKAKRLREKAAEQAQNIDAIIIKKL